MARKTGSHSDITGPKIREAARALFARHGFAAVSMRQIAAEVGVQAGALYNYTPDKQSLLLDIMRDHMEEALDQRKAAADVTDGLPPKARLEEWVKFHIGWNLPRRNAVFIAYMELRNLSDENFPVIEDLRRHYEDELEGIIKDGMAAGCFAVEDTKIAAYAILGMLTGMNNWYRADGRLSVEELQDLYWRLICRAVGTTP